MADAELVAGGAGATAGAAGSAATGPGGAASAANAAYAAKAASAAEATNAARNAKAASAAEATDTASTASTASTAEAAEAAERDFLAAYDPREYPPIAVTVDVVALTIRDAGLQVLLVQRAGPPYQHQWALPGGFVRQLPGPDGTVIEEDLAEAAARELAEEAGPRLRTQHLEQLRTYGAPGRDPRMRVVSVAYLAFAPGMPEARSGSDAADAQWVPVAALGLAHNGRQQPGTSRKLAFDHARILADGLDRARAKLEYTPLATAFVTEPFTISELREVYETVWGEKLHPGNFHRKVLSVPGFVDSTGDMTQTGGPKGGPRSKLYRRGDARLLHPALLRPGQEEEVR